jgi:hypothetical protein
MPLTRLPVINGGLVKVPLWTDHHRAKNWAAVIDINGTAPGGYSRRFLPYGRGPVFYIVDQVAPFDALEFAGDRVSYSGNKTPERWYGVVTSMGPDFLEVQQTEDGTAAVLLAQQLRRAPKEGAPACP